ncbi:MAG: single-stranded DNA-binding protein [Chloroflexota bacterium]
MAGMSKAIIIGNLGRDPEMRYTPSGAAVTSFSVACSRRYRTGDGEQREETEWFKVDCWNKLAETANEYLSKGKQVYIEGRLSMDTWDDRQSGEKRSQMKITANELQMLGSRDDSGGGIRSGDSSDRAAAPAGAPDTDFDNMPF